MDNSNILSALGVTSNEVLSLPVHTDIKSILKVKSMRRTTRLWILDLNLCHTGDVEEAMEEPETLILHLTETFFEEYPYYPLPLVENDVERK